MDMILPILVNGCAMALVALGFHLVIRSTGGIVDFAVGQYAIISGMAAASIGSELGLGTVFAVGLGCLAATTVAGINEVAVVRPAIALNRNPVAMAPVLATVALLTVWEQVARLVFGDFPLRGPSFFPRVKYVWGDILISAHSIVIIIVTIFVFLAVQLWLTRTKSGRILRAIGDNRLAAQLLGFPVNRSRILAFMIAGATVGIAGALVSPLAGFRALGGGYYTLNGFVALFLGGASSPVGALIGGMVLEGIKITVGRYLGTGYQDYIVLIIALLVFAFRPQGLLGAKKTRSG
jgi:branched-chain amino acid transport system permease protein